MKWKAAEDPHYDFTASVSHLSYYVHEIRSGKVVLLSDVEVYNDTSSLEATREDLPSIQDARSTYAYHKLLAEDMVLRFSPKSLVLRLPTLVGPGLRRNTLFDLMHSERPIREVPDSSLNVVHTTEMAAKLINMLDAEAEGVFNLAAPDSVPLDELARIAGRTPSFRPDPGAKPTDQMINVEKLSDTFQCESSRDALSRYCAELENRAESA